MSEIKVPELGESITEGTVGKWYKQAGDTVQTGDVLLELETDKVNLEISAEEEGKLAKIAKREGETVQVGDVLGMIELAGSMDGPGQQEEPSSAQTPESGESPSTSAGESAPDTPPRILSPSARKQARMIGHHPEDKSEAEPDHGTANREEPAKQDERQKQAEQGKQVETAERAQSAASAGVTINHDLSRPAERVRMSRRRRTIAARLVEAQHTAAMLTTFNEVDMSAVMDIRKRRKQAFQEKHQVNLGFMSFFSKAVVGALKRFPRLNAEIDGEDMIMKKYYDIGIAVAAQEGLVVPVVRGVDRLSFAEIERQIAELAEKARSNALTLSDLQGGTFTITNGGVFGSLMSTPILNTPQVGILGMHTIKLRPVAVDEKRSENRPMMYIALSYDHRIVDGSEAVQFLVAVKEQLEDPETLLLEG